MFVDLTAFFGTVVGLAIIAMHWFDFGWQKTELVGLTAIISTAWAIIGVFVEKTMSSLFLWMVGTFLVYVAAIALLFQFSWFGFRG